MSAIENNTVLQQEEEKVSNVQLVVFRQGSEEYGMTIDQIKEVVVTPNITKMPETASYIKGVANIRGNIISIIDLEDKFKLGDSSIENANRKNYTLVIDSDEIKMGLIVREVPNTLSINTNQIESSLSVASEEGIETNYIKGIVKLKERLIILIDIFKVINTADQLASK